MTTQETITQAIREACAIPPYLEACADAVRYDLLYGPSFSRIPAAGVEAFTADDFATFASDLELEEGDTLTETYVGPVADALASFIDALPSTLYVDAESGCVIGVREPEGEWLHGDTMEPCEPDDEGAEYFEPCEYYALEGRDIVAALFGRTIAHEFR